MGRILRWECSTRHSGERSSHGLSRDCVNRVLASRKKAVSGAAPIEDSPHLLVA